MNNHDVSDLKETTVIPISSIVHTVTIDQLIEETSKYNLPEESQAKIRQAYELSAKAHEGQFRRSGESYVEHPLNVAWILASMKVDATCLITALLHDTLEDTTLSSEQIESLFGSKVVSLIDGVTKIGKFHFQATKAEKQAENFRKMLLSMSEDIRVILVKLADRLHNMRTISSLNIDRQRAIAQETLEIYAPLANRLGIGWIKSELEDLSFSVQDRETYLDLKVKVSNRRRERKNYISTIVKTVQEALIANNLQGEVQGRYKHIYSIYRKMTIQEIPFEEIYDLMGIRIITDTKLNCYAILGLLHSLWKPMAGRIKDFIAVPKSNMYQSLHTTVIGSEGIPVEFQIRTEEMHRVAEEGIAAHWNYKENADGSPAEGERKVVAWLRQLVEWQKELPDNREFMDSVKVNLFPDEVYVFTPKGQVKEMIKGSTAIDFAYSIHTELGHHCMGARINGRWSPIKTELQSGDIVEIISSPSQSPSKDWLRFVATPRARARVRHWLKEEEDRQSAEIGRKSLENEFRKARLNLSDYLKSPYLEVILSYSDQPAPTLENVYSRIGFGQLSPNVVLRKLVPVTQETPEQELPHESFPVSNHPVVVRGGGKDLLISLARCCSPVPGEEIIGYISRGRGVVIHSRDCPNLVHLSIQKERLIQSTWDNDPNNLFEVQIRVLMEDKPGMLAGVSAAISEKGANINHAEVKQDRHKMAVIEIALGVKNTSDLESIMEAIRRVKGVISVQRLKRMTGENSRRSEPA
ncbi:RelA/SpoT family protein [Leptospirillum ferrooxidans]|jgi:GTP pyrophosphokinase|uniref:GTP pyrophosphokinase n=2 Tax=root TaxID=1 RepID=I0INQ5_LEPFC|nr:bifunctional (p)ppGpp synthetase/guanosine-3',5'-bis(diphosphate) 3'-pyrophosphohydrolase [Leptospirillum ferrooxidans]BAM06904.1 GTP pyrophosphokinase [Leptospirillum ferrooxidans C2-3]